MTCSAATVRVQQAILFVSAFDPPAEDPLRALAETLQRVAVQTDHQRLVDLRTQPALGRQYRVQVVPCLVLDTGTRHIRLPGDPARLDCAQIEHALYSP